MFANVSWLSIMVVSLFAVNPAWAGGNWTGKDVVLIVDADSSQHSALIDAMRGQNLVIEGPPGTGKSQTITNLIALLELPLRLGAVLQIVERRPHRQLLFVLDQHHYVLKRQP